MVCINFSIRVFWVFFIVLLTSCGGGGSSKQNNIETPTSNTPSSRATIEEVLNSAVNRGIDGIFVYVDQTSKHEASYSAGLQDKTENVPASTSALFKIASISKLFIAVSATKIIVQEQLSLNDTLSTWLPEWADRIENSNIITIKQLIQHRSGIADFDSQVGFSWQHAHRDIDATLAYALDKPADFAPDSKYEYSNTNYLLLAKVLDKALGYSHQIFIKENILIPLAMHDTYLELAEIDMPLLAKGYWENVERSRQDYVIPGGSMISTVKDIAIFIRALNTGTLLTPEEKRIYASVYWFNHSGWLPGYQSIANYHSDIDAVVIQFINTTGDGSENTATWSYQQIVKLLGN